MKEQHYSQEHKKSQIDLNRSDDEMALRALSLRIYSATWVSTDLTSLVDGLSFNPIAIAQALLELEAFGIINLNGPEVTKSESCERKILVLRSKLIRVKNKAAWKSHDVRKLESIRFVIESGY